ncbi:hypothetical protein BJX66DRAFT_338815 [Aspergillus keveii]|uniref:UDP-glucose/GDP-mannose dehydrogenase N-terminal domain-containing protein n=1 Tax=Aspergillus keveii TaxID=714993 RepID=A0ABR4G3F3_9EURO
MIFFIPILIILAGVAILLHRRYLAQREQEGPRVVVKGHTYSEVVESKPVCVAESNNRVGDVNRCCIIGAGRVGAMTGIVLASNNPQVQFSIVDTNERLIAAWKSDRPPITDPGLENILFDDECLAIEGIDNDTTTTTALASKNEEVMRRRKIQNLSFSSDVHATVASAQIVFLCVEMDELDTSFAHLDPTLQTIATASSGPKVIVQRATSPYKTVWHIKEHLESLTPNIHHTILTNPLPSFPPPSCSTSSPLSETRVIIGHIYSPSSRPEDIDALKKLYTPFVPAERIVTMDAYSAELGRMGQTAVLAQQMGSLASLSVLSGACEASTGAVGWMVGSDTAGCSVSGSGGMVLGAEFREVTSELQCLVHMAKESGMEEVAEYWGSLLKVQEFLVRRAVRRLIKEMGTDEEGKKGSVAVVGFGEQRGVGSIATKELRSAGLEIKVAGDQILQKPLEVELGEGIDVVGCVEQACSGCSGVVFLGSTRVQPESLQDIARCMKERRVLSLRSGLDGVKMKQLGFEVL